MSRYVVPGVQYRVWWTGQPTGAYTVGTDVLVTKTDGQEHRMVQIRPDNYTLVMDRNGRMRVDPSGRVEVHRFPERDLGPLHAAYRRKRAHR